MHSVALLLVSKTSHVVDCQQRDFGVCVGILYDDMMLVEGGCQLTTSHRELLVSAGVAVKCSQMMKPSLRSE